MTATATAATIDAPAKCQQCGIPVGIGADGFCGNCREKKDDERQEVEPAAPPAAIGAYRELEERISGCEADAIRARWDFGRALLAEREANGGKKLPDGRLDELADALAIASRVELKNRMQFAAEYADPAAALAEFGSWHAICCRGLGERARGGEGNPPARTTRYLRDPGAVPRAAR